MHYDVIILGGGLVGSVLAGLLTQKNIRVLIVDKIKPEDQFDPTYDGRTTAVNYGASRIFNEIGIWDLLEKDAQPINHIRVFENQSAWSVDYDHSDIGPNPMGYVLENHQIRLKVHQRLQELQVNWLITNNKTYDIQYHPHHVELTFNQLKYQTALLIGAEGRSSNSRMCTNIRASTWEYGQTALVAHILHNEPHHSTAWEIFTTEGPLAILPLTNCAQTNQHRSGIVWSGAKNHPRLNSSDSELANELFNIFPYYGAISLCSKRWHFPLSALEVNTLIDHRYALVGDAAHGMHPIAGQGVNVGWVDAKVLADILGNAHSLGLDLGFSSTLNEYNDARSGNHRKMLWATDKIHKLFMSKKSSMHFLRNLGFAAVNNIKPIKKLLMKQAMGI